MGIEGMWLLVLTTTILPLIYSILSIISIKKRLWLKVWERPKFIKAEKRISVIIPLYKEGKEDILLTLKSVENQDYPKELIEVLVVVEKEDHMTKKALSEALNEVKLQVKVVEVCGRRGKWFALNEALRSCEGELAVIYDAGDVVDREHLKKVASLSPKYDIIGSKVYRRGPSLVGLLSYVDTLLWYNVLVPAFSELLGVTLVSGEGLTLKERVLFPNCLAEDAFLTLYAMKKGLRLGLVDSVIVEGAPSSLKSLVKQRVRWYRGFLECLAMTLKEDIGLIDKIKLSLVYMTPLASLSVFILIALLLLSPLLNPPLWFVILTSFIFTTLFIAPLFAYVDMGLRDVRIFLSPFHWLLQGFIVLTALFIKDWFKTTRSYGNLGNSSTSISQLPNSEGDGKPPL